MDGLGGLSCRPVRLRQLPSRRRFPVLQLAAGTAGRRAAARRRNRGEAVLGAPVGAMREWCPRCGRKSLLRLTRRDNGDRVGYTCGNCGLGFIISEANLEAMRATRSPPLRRDHNRSTGTSARPSVPPLSILYDRLLHRAGIHGAKDQLARPCRPPDISRRLANLIRAAAC
jgi:predicted RNA-binding Zn-ribbon protein involved in translation (DUF1610 family)